MVAVGGGDVWLSDSIWLSTRHRRALMCWACILEANLVVQGGLTHVHIPKKLTMDVTVDAPTPTCETGKNEWFC